MNDIVEWSKGFKERTDMSVTVADILKLPSLPNAVIVAGSERNVLNEAIWPRTRCEVCHKTAVFWNCQRFGLSDIKGQRHYKQMLHSKIISNRG